jgi:ABC-type antimicrobial peptide transport system permease subunit
LGRHFHRGEGLDKEQSIVVNESLVRKFHLREPLGKQIKMDNASYTIIGIVQDYKEFGLHGLVPPCILRLAGTDDFRYLVARAKESNLVHAENTVKKAWYQVVPFKAYTGFLQSDVVLKEKYMNAGLQTVSLFLSGIIILLSASGLFALVSLNILRRNKEIGVRKVLGASVLGITSLLSKEFLTLVAISFLIASPIAWYVMRIWLQGYSYRIDIEWWMLMVAAILSMLIALITVSFQAIKAALANPVKSLRTE